MAYDESLAERISDILAGKGNITKKKMFGGVGYLLNGNMACGVHQANLIVRVGPNCYQTALEHPKTLVFDLTGRPMTGWVAVIPEGTNSEEELAYWVDKGIKFAETLPPK